jgi:branched-chain amino acid transport system permease protein
MFDLSIIWASVLNGVTTGAIYALIALGLTLIYGVLHIVNFAHGAALMVALYGVYFLFVKLHIDPYMALPIMIVAMFVFGYLLQRTVIARAARGSEQSVLLVTLGISIVLTNLALFFFKSDTNTIDTSYSLQTVDILGAAIALPKVVAFFGALATAALLLLLIHRTSLGRAIRAVSREQRGARVVGIDVERIYALSFGIGLACLGAAACFLLPAYYVNPQVGDGFVLIAFTIVVLGGMGSFMGALWGGLIIGVTESLGGLWFGDSLGQMGIFLLFVAVLAFRPQGMFGRKGA